jgi:hypothetical protein
MKTELTLGEVSEFHKLGFVSIPQITTADEVIWIRDVCDRLFERRAGWETGDLFDFAGTDAPGTALNAPQLSHPSKYEPALLNTHFYANALTMARQLLGPTAQFVFDHSMLKPARTGASTPWHQDEAFYPFKGGSNVLTFWMPLQDVDSRNGCLNFIPGSNLGPLLEHRRINNDRRIHGLEALGVDETLMVPCPLSAGGATVHGYHTLHHSNPNLSDGPRRAYAVLFGTPLPQFQSREGFSWNEKMATQRLKREAKSQGMLRRLARRVKTVAKALVR